MLVPALIAAGGILQAGQVRFLPLNDEIAGRELAVRDAKGTKALENLSPGKRSAALAVEAGDKPLQLVALDRQAPGAAAPTVEIALAADLKSPLVLIVPDAEDPTGLRPIVIDDSQAGFPWGSLHFVNTTGQELVARYEKEEKPLPASTEPVSISPGGETRMIGIEVCKEEEEKPVYSAVWQHDPKIRKLVFIVVNADGDLYEVKVVPEDQRSK